MNHLADTPAVLLSHSLLDPAAAVERAHSLVQLGGPVIMALGAMSLIGVAVVLLKVYQFVVLRVEARRFIGDCIGDFRGGEIGRCMEALALERNPIARVLEVAVSGRARAGADMDLVRERTHAVAAGQLEFLRSYFRVLEVIASLSPLLGLFGTVLGMIDAFQRLQEAGTQVDPAILSGGIWEALLTTAAGLAVAIPAVIAVTWLQRTAERLGHDMETAATEVFTAELGAGGTGDETAAEM